MPLVLPELPVRMRTGAVGGFSDAALARFSSANPNLRIERNAKGEVTVMPPASSESGYRSLDAAAQLRDWARKDGRGRAFESSAGFRLVDGSILSPDAAWVSKEAIRRLPEQHRKGFLPLCPEFVIEVLSPSDSLKEAQEKMKSWIANGAKLGWLIDADHRTVYIYREHRRTTVQRNAAELAGQGPVAGFVLKLDDIWQGLS